MVDLKSAFTIKASISVRFAILLGDIVYTKKRKDFVKRVMAVVFAPMNGKKVTVKTAEALLFVFTNAREGNVLNVKGLKSVNMENEKCDVKTVTDLASVLIT